MAEYRVYDQGQATADGTTWATAYKTLKAATDVSTKDDAIWLAPSHSETIAGSQTYALPSAPGLRVLGVDSDSADPATGMNATPAATVSLGAVSAGMIFNGFGYFSKIRFQSATNNTSAVNITLASTSISHGLYFDGCAFEIRGTNSQSDINVGAANQSSNDDVTVVLTNCTLKFGGTGQSVTVRQGRIRFENVSLDSSGASPTALLTGSPGGAGTLVWEASDLSGVSFGNLVDLDWGAAGDVTVRNCKLPAGAALVTNTPNGPGGVKLRVHNCDSGDTTYNFFEADFAGTVVDETTLVRTGGGAVSYRMDSSAGVKFPYIPLTVEGSVYNETVGSEVTLTVEILHDSQGSGTDSALTDRECWLEVQHLGVSGVPQGVVDTDDRAEDIFATAADQAASSATWTTTGMTSPVKQKLTCAFTPQEAGYVHFKVCLAAVDKTVYADIAGASIA